MRQFLWAVAVTALVLGYGAGCTPRNDQSGSPNLQSSFEQESPLEVECERELFYLDGLIQSTRQKSGFPTAVLAEVVELRLTAVDLILDEEFELALELMDEAVALIKQHS